MNNLYGPAIECNWIFPENKTPPSGRLEMLTIGGAVVIGEWRNGGVFTAWRFPKISSKKMPL